MRDGRWLQVFCICFFVGWLLIAVVVACGKPKPAAVPSKPYRPPEYAERRVPVVCMDKPPDVAWPTWPAADRLGTVVMHASTVDKIREGIAQLEGYVQEQYDKCRKAGVEGFEPGEPK